ncbi:MAG TPA: MarR family transcriptional regulator [Steroidobacteraceae bacterium]|jgi:MarR family transcriptional repressor of emrRAB|nr:MarR family transcriptional regulator [Steroidobacteraceae bacterium]
MDNDQPPTVGPLQQRANEVETAVLRSAGFFKEIPARETLILRLMVLLGREISALLEEILEPRGLSETEYRTLMMLVSQPDGIAHPSDLCADVAQSPANMTRVADGLYERGLITRVASEEDRRRTILRITPAGESLVRTLLPDTTERVRAIFAEMSQPARSALLEHLRSLLVRIDQCAPGSAAAAGGQMLRSST